MCFIISCLLVLTILVASDRIHGIEYFLLPGMLLPLLISNSSNTGDFSFVAGMIVNAMFYTVLLLTISKRIEQRTKIQSPGS
jgi:hypothetical protein